MKQNTYSSEVLAHTKKYRENSYFQTPSRVDDFSQAAAPATNKDARAGTKPSTQNMVITSPTVPTGTITMEQRSILDEAEQTTDDEKDMYSTLVRELKRIDQEDNIRQNNNIPDAAYTQQRVHF